MIRFTAVFFCFVVSAVSLAGVEYSFNGSFENGLRPWNYPYWDKTKKMPGEVTDQTAFDGKKSFLFHRPGERVNFIYFSHKVEGELPHTLRFHLKCDNIPANDFFLKIQCFQTDPLTGEVKAGNFLSNRKNNSPLLIQSGGTHDWKEFTVSISKDELKQVSRLCFYFYRTRPGNGRLWIDNVRLSMDGTVPPKPALGPIVPPDRRARNLAPFDSSFETTSDAFPCDRDPSTAAHGSFSLRIPAGVREVQGKRMFRLQKPGRPYSITLWLKADRPAEIQLQSISDIWNYAVKETLNVGTDWKMYGVHFKVSQTNANGVNLLFRKPEEVTLWVDAIQINEGDFAAYEPEMPVRASMDRIDPAGDTMFISDEKVVRSLNLRNNTSRTEKAEVLVELETYRGDRKTLFRKDVVLKSGEACSYPVELLPSGKRGYYVVRVRMKSRAGETLWSMPFQIVDPPLPPSRDSYFGIHGSPYSRKIGASLIRNFLFWKDAVRDKNGEYVFNPDSLKEIDASGMFHFCTINLVRPPRDLVRGDHADPKEISNYLQAALRHWKARTEFIEIENEPDYAYPGKFRKGILYAAERYAKIVAENAPELRKIFPEMTLLACGSSADCRWNYKFMRKFNETAARWVDVYGIHPYTATRFISSAKTDISPEDGRLISKTREALKILRDNNRNQKLWYGEIGYAMAVEEDFLSDAAFRQAAYLARILLIGKALGVKKCFYFMQEGCVEMERYYYGIWRGYQPLPAAAVYAAAAQILEGAEPLFFPREKTLFCTAFRHRDGRPFAAVWLNGGIRSELTLPCQSGDLELRDMFNNPVNLPSGPFHAGISQMPVYLFAKKQSEQEFLALLDKLKVTLPPFELKWTLLRADALRLTMENTGKQTISGTFSAKGVSGFESSVPFSIPPGGKSEFNLQAKEQIAGRQIDFLFRIGGQSYRIPYFADLFVCPESGWQPESDHLPEAGRLPVFDNTKWLLPSDPNIGWDGPADLSAAAAMTHDEKYFYLSVNVRDDLHHATKRELRELQNADSVQLAFDTRANAGFSPKYDDDDYEFVFALVNGKPTMQTAWPYDADFRRRAEQEIRFRIRRDGTQTIYRIAVPWSLLNISPEAGRVFGMNFSVNDNDGYGRQYWMCLAPGVAEKRKNPYAFKKIMISPTSSTQEKKEKNQ